MVCSFVVASRSRERVRSILYLTRVGTDDATVFDICFFKSAQLYRRYVSVIVNSQTIAQRMERWGRKNNNRLKPTQKNTERAIPCHHVERRNARFVSHSIQTHKTSTRKRKHQRPVRSKKKNISNFLTEQHTRSHIHTHNVGSYQPNSTRI